MSIEAVPITPGLVRPAARAVAEGFFDNEIWVWLLPREWQRRRVLPRHYRAMIRRVYLPREGAWTTADALGAALWFPPGTLELSRRERFAEIASLLPEGIDSLGRGRRWDELLGRHHPREPHWYLQTLAVAPEAQRGGVGTALIEPGLTRADADGVGAFLETQREANIPYYERFGFGLTEEISLPDSPPLWLMWREPRPSERRRAQTSGSSSASLASLHEPGGTRRAMSPRPHSSSGQSEVSTASTPASVSCWRQARAASSSPKSLTTSQSSNRGSPI